MIGARTVIPPNFRSEPYGIYVGSPARLVKFRFPEKIRECLMELAWWDMPLQWIKDHNDAFLADLTSDEGRALEMLSELKRAKSSWVEAPQAG
ncbi:streptogramin acetyl transferase [Caballeronia cordobensis]|uniref:Streptogramin acetyl transferase n=1 Tax=Caballeronia cordobensis TaxID=1353886 RepID=A0A158HXQ0_CABCO|nr:streptogramin acetyl transferase [Caballeronia cordobensis]